MFKFLKKYFCCFMKQERDSVYLPKTSETDFNSKRVSVNVSISNLSDISMDSL